MIDQLPQTLMRTDLSLPGQRQGKVRDIYQATLDDGTDVLLIIASDRISAFDVVMPNGVPGKGVVLTQISKFWFDMVGTQFGDRIRHHLLATNADAVHGLSADERAAIRGRVMVGTRTNVVPIECVVRGYITGSGWKEYQKTGEVCGIKLPDGLRQCDKLPEPIFTPATKEETGHDENISFEIACGIAGEPLMTKLRDLSLAIYQMGHDYAAQRGIILADTKFEFGTRGDGDAGALYLIDEVLTPDSSRFWPADQYEAGRDQDSFDKQYVRNYLETIVAAGDWDKTSPGPELPDDVVRNTLEKYLDAYRLLTGRELDFDATA